MNKVKAFLSKFDFNDFCAAAGVACFFYGAWKIYAPVAFILLGAGLIWWGVMGSRKRKSK